MCVTVTSYVYALQLINALDKLQECRRNLNDCLEENARLSRYGLCSPVEVHIMYVSILKLSIFAVKC